MTEKVSRARPASTYRYARRAAWKKFNDRRPPGDTKVPWSAFNAAFGGNVNKISTGKRKP